MDSKELLLKLRSSQFHNIYNIKHYLELLDSGVDEVVSDDNSAIIYDDNDVKHVYWIINDSCKLLDLVERVNQQTLGSEYITEIVYRGEEPRFVKELIDAGFVEHARLEYMTKGVINTSGHRKKNGESATIEDVEEIHRLLYEGFDPRISHLPNLSQIKEMIKLGEINIIKLNNEIAALSIFQREGKQSKYLYQLLVSKKYRNKGLAKLLLDDEFNFSNGKDIYSLWVEKNNTKAIKIYSDFGFSSSSKHVIVFKSENNIKL